MYCYYAAAKFITLKKLATKLKEGAPWRKVSEVVICY